MDEEAEAQGRSDLAKAMVDKDTAGIQSQARCKHALLTTMLCALMHVDPAQRTSGWGGGLLEATSFSHV